MEPDKPVESTGVDSTVSAKHDFDELASLTKFIVLSSPERYHGENSVYAHYLAADLMDRYHITPK